MDCIVPTNAAVTQASIKGHKADLVAEEGAHESLTVIHGGGGSLTHFFSLLSAFRAAQSAWAYTWKSPVLFSDLEDESLEEIMFN